MYEVTFIVKPKKIYQSIEAFDYDWHTDLPNYIHIRESLLNKYQNSITRRDPAWINSSNTVEVVILFTDLSNLLDFTRDNFIQQYGLDVNKTIMNDVDFKNYILSTNINILDGKYNVSVKNIKEVGI